MIARSLSLRDNINNMSILGNWQEMGKCAQSGRPAYRAKTANVPLREKREMGRRPSYILEEAQKTVTAKILFMFGVQVSSGG